MVASHKRLDTLADSYTPLTSRKAGSAAERAEKAKSTLYQEISRDYIFTPIAIETLGSGGQLSHGLIKEISQKIRKINGERRSSFYLFQRISMAIQRGNAASVFGTVVSTSKLDKMFHL